MLPWRVFAPDAFRGQVTLVTGAASGIGRATAVAFGAMGSDVVLADRDESGARSAAKDILCAGGRARAVRTDVANEPDVGHLYEVVDSSYGRVDNLVTCAAIITARSGLDHDRAHWQRVLDVNLLGTYTVLQHGLHRMFARGSGQVVAVASDAGKKGGGGLVADAAYAASKAGVLSLVKSLAREYSGRGVRINALTPGPTDTAMHFGLTDEQRQRISEGLPLGRMGYPVEMAAAICFLRSPAASFVYGASLNVDGGGQFE